MTTNRSVEKTPTPGLSIGELASRTGLTPGTLRAWEDRHGFPTPLRRDSGHRRYSTDDVAVVLQVLRRRDAGVRLSSAVQEVLAARRTPAESVFGELRRRHPHLNPQRLRKSTLLALTSAIEDECCAGATRPTIFAAFQHVRHYERARSRYEDLARTARRTVVFASADDGAPTDRPDGPGQPSLVHLPGGSPLRREWLVVCDAPDRPAALAGWELPGQSSVKDADRVFEVVWTLERETVRAAARAGAALAERLAPEQHEHGFPELDEPPGPDSVADLVVATELFNRVVGYVDAQDGAPGR